MKQIIDFVKPAIAEAHLKEWTEDSAVSEEITRLNVVSLDDSKQIADRLGWKAYTHTSGWWCSGVNPRNGLPMGTMHGQFKPDEKLQFPDREKPAKYLTSKADPDALCLAMSDKDYWPNVIADPSVPVLITEGTKKAGAGLTIGYATIALMGVAMGFQKLSAKLMTNLKPFIVPGRVIYLAFDSDILIKKEVQQALRKLSKELEVQGCIVKVISWEPQEGKGMDDFIVANGDDAFRQRITSAQLLQQWEQQFSETSEKKRTDKTPNSIDVARHLADKYQPFWKYDLEGEVWRKFDGKKWATIKDGLFDYLVFQELEADKIGYSKPFFIDEVIKTLKRKLLIADWSSQMFDRKQWIPFANGVLELATGEMHEHSPGFMNTSCLDYDYHQVNNPDNKSIVDLLKENCPQVYTDWMRSQSGSHLRMELLLAVINGVIKWRIGYDLQKFVHVTGKPRTGKGVYTRTVQKIIGRDNYTGTTPQALNEQCGLAEIIDKQLVTMPDIRTTVPTEKLLMLTGGDEIRYRQLYKAGTSKRFDGCLLLTSNDPIFKGNTTGIDERLIMLQFDNPVSETKRTSLIESQLEKEIPKLISVALMLSDIRVSKLLKSMGDTEIPEYKALAWQHKITQDSVAAFLNEKVVRADGQGINASECYELYKVYCGEAGRKPISMVTFKKHLIEDLCQSWWGWDEVDYKRTKTAVLFRNIDVRRDGSNYPDTPTLDIYLDPSLALTPSWGVELKPLQGMGGVGLKGEKDDRLVSFLENQQPNNAEKFLTSNPTYPTPALQGAGFNPTPDPTSILHWCRVEGEKEPTVDHSEASKAPDVGLEEPGVGLDTGPGVGLKPLQDKAGVGYVGLEAKNLFARSEDGKPKSLSLPTSKDWKSAVDDRDAQGRSRSVWVHRPSGARAEVWEEMKRILKKGKSKKVTVTTHQYATYYTCTGEVVGERELLPRKRHEELFEYVDRQLQEKAEV